ncbi:MAG: hypothetical protein WCP39_06610 [Chlamydiota bacterium]
MKKILVLISCLIAFRGESVQIFPVAASPEPNSLILQIVLPLTEDIVSQDPVRVQLRLRGYPLGIKSVLPRADEVLNFPEGQSIHVVVDGRPYFPKSNTPVDLFSQNDSYYETMYQFEIPYALAEGKHLLEVFPARSFGESLKGEGCYASQIFYVKNTKANPKLDGLDRPYLIYSEPGNYFRFQEGKPILLDFYIRNVTLESDGYKVHIFLDNEPMDFLKRWGPYYMLGVKKGEHTLRLQLVDKNHKPLEGEFCTVEGKFIVE